MVKINAGLYMCILVATMMFVCQPKLAATETATANAAAGSRTPAPPSPAALGIEFVKDSTSSVIVERDGKRYIVDLVSHTVRESSPPSTGPGAERTPAASALVADPADGAKVFQRNCTTCHGPDGKGLAALKTPDFTDPKIQASLTDDQILNIITNGKPGTAMPRWADKLSGAEIKAVAAYVRSLGSTQAQPSAGTAQEQSARRNVYQPGDDVLMTLPTGRRLDRHGFYVNFAHRFAYDPAFSGTARGGALLGLDGFAIPSFGFRYGFTNKLSGSIFRAPSVIGRPIQLMLAYNFTDERDGYPLNVAVRISMEGQNTFKKNYTENIEGIFSRSITSRAQLYLVPTVSFNDRQLASGGYEASTIPDLPGHNSFSLGVGGALDIRPTVALIAEVIPTLASKTVRNELGIHRPAYAFGIQKKIWRHSFTFGFTTSPGTTVSQRAGTRASFLGDPHADTPSGLFVGFDLTRQIY